MSRLMTSLAIVVLCGATPRAHADPPPAATRPEGRAAGSQPAASQPGPSPSLPGGPTRRPAGPDGPLPAGPPEGDPFEGLDHSGTPVLPPAPGTGLHQPPAAAAPGSRRPAPSYDGREAQGVSAGEVLIWVPRALFLPTWIVLEYGLRWPVIKLVTTAEKHHLFERIQRLFTWSDGRAGIYPTTLLDFGLNPSIGIYSFYNDLGVKNHSLSLQAGFWYTGWYNLVATDSFKVFRNDGGTVTTRARFTYRPDFPFHGIGWDSGGAEYFFRQRVTEVDSTLKASLKDLNRVSLSLSYRNVAISGGQDSSVDGDADPFDLAGGGNEKMPGYGETYNLLTIATKAEIDSRNPDRVFNPGSGLRLELFGSFSFDPDMPDLNFFRWGGEAAGFWDVSGVNHVLALRFYVEMLESSGDATVPVTDRIILGGPEYLRGYLEGRFVGDSAMVITADYRYPIWILLDANLFVSIGNVFEGRFEGLRVEHMVMSWGLGLRSNTSRDVSFDFVLAFGTNPMGRWSGDFRIDNVRVLVGLNQGF